MYSTNSTIVMKSGTTNFVGNYAELAGGAYFGNFSALITVTKTQQFFESNSASNFSGGAIHCQYGRINFAGTSQFMRNSVDFKQDMEAGGAVFTIECTLTGRALFGYNHAPKGGAIGATNSIVFCSGTPINFSNNWASLAGGGLALANSSIEITSQHDL